MKGGQTFRRINYRILTAPYVRLTRRIISGPGTPESIAFETEVLCPEETQTTPAPVYMPEHIDRLVPGTVHPPLSWQIESMLRTTTTHAPTKAYHLKDAIIHRGSVYAKNMRWFLFDPVNLSRTSGFRHFDRAALVSTEVGCRHFGHWLQDDCVQHLLASSNLPTIAVGEGLSLHQNSYASLFSQDWTLNNSAIVDHLVIYQDFGENSFKRERSRRLASYVARAFPSTGRNGLVFLRRGKTGARRVIHNEAALLDTLTARGFDIVDIEADLANIIGKLRTAKLVISMEGSHLSHCAYSLDEGSAILVLQPCDRFLSYHRGWTSCRGIKFGFAVGKRASDAYEYSTDELLRLSDKLLEAA